MSAYSLKKIPLFNETSFPVSYFNKKNAAFLSEHKWKTFVKSESDICLLKVLKHITLQLKLVVPVNEGATARVLIPAVAQLNILFSSLRNLDPVRQ